MGGDQFRTKANILNAATLLLLIYGAYCIILFYIDIFLPIWMSVALFVVISVYLRESYLAKRTGILMPLMWLVYALPFIHIIPYIWYDFAKEDPLILWGLAVNPYMVDEQVIQLTAMIGAVGGLGVALGVSLSRGGVAQASHQVTKAKTLMTPVWLVWVIVGVVLSWLSAPEDTILTVAYTESTTALDNADFSSAWMVSYGILTFAFCDLLFDRIPSRKALKQKIFYFSLAFVVIYLQLLRGDRESISFVFAVLLAQFYWAASLGKQRNIKIPWMIIAPAAFCLVSIAMFFGVMRSLLSQVEDFGQFMDLMRALDDSGMFTLSNLLHGTWSAVLLTPLSVAGDHIYGLLPLKMGQDYINLLLSIPPGFVADMFGYVRPVNSMSSPAWDMRYGIGGTHAVVIPFMNFRMIGTFVIPAVWAYVLACGEKSAMKKPQAVKLALLAILAMASPHWLWYGEKGGMNALVIWFVLAQLYKISLSLQKRLFLAPPSSPSAPLPDMSTY